MATKENLAPRTSLNENGPDPGPDPEVPKTPPTPILTIPERKRVLKPKNTTVPVSGRGHRQGRNIPVSVPSSSDEEEEGEIRDNDNRDNDDDDDSDEDDASMYYTKEPILLTVKNALVDFLHEIDPSYGDLITFPIFQEFVRSHSSTLVYDNKTKTKAVRRTTSTSTSTATTKRRKN
ncbi:MAG: hypothetical protein WB421_13690 [Terriglobales bacterium]